nr:MAG TPA: hypothetical protein [Caudoviricetes sp.]
MLKVRPLCHYESFVQLNCSKPCCSKLAIL